MIIRISEKSSYFFAGKHRSESRENKRFISNSPFIKVPFLHLKPSVKGFWVNFKWNFLFFHLIVQKVDENSDLIDR